MKIITANERLATRGKLKAVIVGRAGVGKTSLLRTLPVDTTLFIDLEAGDIAVKDWNGDTIRPKTWAECRDLAVVVGGADLSRAAGESYSQRHFEEACARLGGQENYAKYETLFIDSITVASRLCMRWCKSQPDCYSAKKGTIDMLAVYGLLGREMLDWLTFLQHIRTKNVFFIGLLDEKQDELKRVTYSLQLEGTKAGLELPGIVDEVMTMTLVEAKDGNKKRVLITDIGNKFGYPAKSRSGALAAYEQPDLTAVLTKVATAIAKGENNV